MNIPSWPAQFDIMNFFASNESGETVAPIVSNTDQSDSVSVIEKEKLPFNSDTDFVNFQMGELGVTQRNFVFHLTQHNHAFCSCFHLTNEWLHSDFMWPNFNAYFVINVHQCCSIISNAHACEYNWHFLPSYLRYIPISFIASLTISAIFSLSRYFHFSLNDLGKFQR